MPYLRLLGHVDLFSNGFIGMLHRHRSELRGADGVRTMVVRDGAYRHPYLLPDGKWTSLRTTISRAAKILSDIAPELDIASATLEQLDPGAHLPWEAGEAGPMAIRVALVTNPMSVVYSGNEGMTLHSGQVLAVDESVLHSCINLGTAPVIHLVFRLARRAVEEE